MAEFTTINSKSTVDYAYPADERMICDLANSLSYNLLLDLELKAKDCPQNGSDLEYVFNVGSNNDVSAEVIVFNCKPGVEINVFATDGAATGAIKYFLRKRYLVTGDREIIYFVIPKKVLQVNAVSGIGMGRYDGYFKPTGITLVRRDLTDKTPDETVTIL